MKSIKLSLIPIVSALKTQLRIVAIFVDFNIQIHKTIFYL
jgi:hypothetical protein